MTLSGSKFLSHRSYNRMIMYGVICSQNIKVTASYKFDNVIDISIMILNK